MTLAKFVENYVKDPVLLIFLQYFVHIPRRLILYLMLNRGVSRINCCLTENYWIKELDKAIS